MKNKEVKIFVISDTHFSHIEKMFEYCNRPKDYEEKILKAMKEIPENDVLLHLGDICIGNDLENHDKYIKPLKCKKWLVLGNHDNNSRSWYLRNGWDFVCYEFTDTYYSKKILFSHKPSQRIEDVDLNIHGHLHNSDFRRYEPQMKGILTDKHKLVALEHLDYKPILLRTFLNG